MDDSITFIGVKTDCRFRNTEQPLEMHLRFCDEQTTVLTGFD